MQQHIQLQHIHKYMYAIFLNIFCRNFHATTTSSYSAFPLNVVWDWVNGMFYLLQLELTFNAVMLDQNYAFFPPLLWTKCIHCEIIEICFFSPRWCCDMDYYFILNFFIFFCYTLIIAKSIWIALTGWSAVSHIEPRVILLLSPLNGESAGDWSQLPAVKAMSPSMTPELDSRTYLTRSKPHQPTLQRDQREAPNPSQNCDF